jgi:hypothetical protein
MTPGPYFICLQLGVRLSHLRCILKRTAAFEVKGFYNLIPGDACKDRVRKLITTTEYIYRRSEVSCYQLILAMLTVCLGGPSSPNQTVHAPVHYLNIEGMGVYIHSGGVFG